MLALLSHDSGNFIVNWVLVVALLAGSGAYVLAMSALGKCLAACRDASSIALPDVTCLFDDSTPSARHPEPEPALNLVPRFAVARKTEEIVVPSASTLLGKIDEQRVTGASVTVANRLRIPS
jgi:hypothetical protein